MLQHVRLLAGYRRSGIVGDDLIPQARQQVWDDETVGEVDLRLAAGTPALAAATPGPALTAGPAPGARCCGPAGGRVVPGVAARLGGGCPMVGRGRCGGSGRP